MQPSRQYKRHATVIVGKSGKGLVIENLRIQFEVTKDHASSPNTALIKIYNLTDEHQAQIRKEYDEVILNAGYEGAEALLFRGNIRHVYRYLEKNDWIVEIDCGDGDQDYRNAIVNETLAAGTSDEEIVNRTCKNFATTKKGQISGVSGSKRLRGKVVSGGAKKVLNNISRQNNCTWSIQDGMLHIIPVNGVLDKEAIVVNASTGLLSAPEQDDKGIKVITLLNPEYAVNSRIKLENDNIKRKKVKQDQEESKAKPKNSAPARLDPDGIYKIYKVVHKGDNRGQEWTSECMCVALDSPFPEKEKSKKSSHLEEYE